MGKKLLLLLAILLFSAPVAWAGSYTLASIDYPPFVIDNGGKAGGMNVEMLEEAFKRMGHTLTVEFMPWKRGMKLVEKGKIAGIFPAFKTAERESFGYFPDEPLSAEATTLFVPSGSSVTFDGDLSKLSGKTFGVISGFSYGKVFDKAKADGVISKFEETDSLDANVRMLTSGRYDVFIGEPFTTMDVMKKKGVTNKAKRLSPDVESTPTYIVLSKKMNLKGLADEISNALKAMKADGTYDKIVAKYSK